MLSLGRSLHAVAHLWELVIAVLNTVPPLTALAYVLIERKGKKPNGNHAT